MIADRSTAPEETIHNEPFEVVPDMVTDAMMSADAIGRHWKCHSSTVVRNSACNQGPNHRSQCNKVLRCNVLCCADSVIKETLASNKLPYLNGLLSEVIHNRPCSEFLYIVC